MTAHSLLGCLKNSGKYLSTKTNSEKKKWPDEWQMKLNPVFNIAKKKKIGKYNLRCESNRLPTEYHK